MEKKINIKIAFYNKQKTGECKLKLIQKFKNLTCTQISPPVNSTCLSMPLACGRYSIRHISLVISILFMIFSFVTTPPNVSYYLRNIVGSNRFIFSALINKLWRKERKNFTNAMVSIHQTLKITKKTKKKVL